MTRHCTGCKQTLSMSFFSKDKHDPTGYTYRCKKCREIYRKAWAARNPKRIKELNDANKEKRKIYYSTPTVKLKYKNNQLSKDFGISLNDYQQMLIDQKNVCAICKQDNMSERYKYFCIDHCHKTGKVRGLLCNLCNRGIGLFKEKEENFLNAIKYLKENK